MSQEEKEEIEDYWLIFAQSFLLSAKLSCQNLETDKDNKYSKATRFDPAEFHSSYQYQPADLFVSIIFNIKHGIEIFVKTITIILTGSYQKGHDIKYLFDCLRKRLPEEFQPLLDELEILILKYYHCEFINSNNQRIVNIYDEMNDVFRYPDNKAKIKINFELVDENLIKMIHEDIDKIYRLFHDLGYEICTKLIIKNCNPDQNKTI